MIDTLDPIKVERVLDFIGLEEEEERDVNLLIQDIPLEDINNLNIRYKYRLIRYLFGKIIVLEKNNENIKGKYSVGGKHFLNINNTIYNIDNAFLSIGTFENILDIYHINGYFIIKTKDKNIIFDKEFNLIGNVKNEIKEIIENKERSNIIIKTNWTYGTKYFILKEGATKSSQTNSFEMLDLPQKIEDFFYYEDLGVYFNDTIKLIGHHGGEFTFLGKKISIPRKYLPIYGIKRYNGYGIVFFTKKTSYIYDTNTYTLKQINYPKGITFDTNCIYGTHNNMYLLLKQGDGHNSLVSLKHENYQILSTGIEGTIQDFITFYDKQYLLINNGSNTDLYILNKGNIETVHNIKFIIYKIKIKNGILFLYMNNSNKFLIFDDRGIQGTDFYSSEYIGYQKTKKDNVTHYTFIEKDGTTKTLSEKKFFSLFIKIEGRDTREDLVEVLE